MRWNWFWYCKLSIFYGDIPRATSYWPTQTQITHHLTSGLYVCLYVLSRIFFLHVWHLILLLISNKKHRSAWHKLIFGKPWRLMEERYPLKQKSHIVISCEPIFSPSDIHMHKHVKYDAFVPCLSLHMQCARDECSTSAYSLCCWSLKTIKTHLTMARFKRAPRKPAVRTFQAINHVRCSGNKDHRPVFWAQRCPKGVYIMWMIFWDCRVQHIYFGAE